MLPRVECKYCAPAAQADAVLRAARCFLDVDPAVWPDADPAAAPPLQEITSLYLDSPARTFLAWHLAARQARFKLRLRRYSAGEDGLAWAEVKHKVRGRVIKTRGRLALGELPQVERGAARGPSGQRDAAALDDFLARQRAFDARPQVLLRCQRRALRGTGVDRALGITVDTDLRYLAGPGCSLAEAPTRGWLPLRVPGPDEPVAVVELKHGGCPPAWMRQLMRRLAPWACSYSKYVAAMRAGVLLEGGRA